jgi:hypothetical protein
MLIPVHRLRLFLALAALVAGCVTSTALAAQRPETIGSYCSPSGDLCFGVVNRSGAVYLEITTFARYFGRYRLCVRPPAAGVERCGSFPIRRQGPVWGGSVRYGRQFPVMGPGLYRVTWKLGAKPLGPTLRFRLPLRRS